jgi:hypothetical protein
VGEILSRFDTLFDKRFKCTRMNTFVLVCRITLLRRERVERTSLVIFTSAKLAGDNVLDNVIKPVFAQPIVCGWTVFD